MLRNHLLNRIARKVGSETAKRVGKKTAAIGGDTRVVSFTFDDYPRTAVENGARLLEEYDVRGTFYAALGLAESDSPCGPIGSAEELMAVAERGHEVGCHTFHHLNCFEHRAGEIDEDCRRNRDAAERLAGARLTSFAYPFGGIDPFSKRIIARSYRTGRTIMPGVNRGKADLAALRSVSMYSRHATESIEQHIEDLSAHGGWLIFHIHDVAEEPSEFGCTLELFERTLKACVTRGHTVLPIRDAANLAVP